MGAQRTPIRCSTHAHFVPLSPKTLMSKMRGKNRRTRFIVVTPDLSGERALPPKSNSGGFLTREGEGERRAIHHVSEHYKNE